MDAGVALAARGLGPGGRDAGVAALLAEIADPWTSVTEAAVYAELDAGRWGVHLLHEGGASGAAVGLIVSTLTQTRSGPVLDVVAGVWRGRWGDGPAALWEVAEALAREAGAAAVRWESIRPWPRVVAGVEVDRTVYRKRVGP